MGLQTFPKTVSDDADVTFCADRVFHSRQEAVTGKARSPMNERPLYN